MNKKIDFLESIKTAILVVLFLTTILLLYLSFNQKGKTFSISDILPGGRTSNIVVNVDEYIAPEYTVQSEGNGRFLISYKNQKEVFDVAKECAASLLSASNVSVSNIASEEYDRISREEKSVQLVFDFDFPFDDFCSRTVGKTLEKPEELKGFRSMLFSDTIKSDLYMRLMNGKCYKISVAENYYSTEALSRVLDFDGGEINSSDIYLLKMRKLSTNMNVTTEKVAENIFGDTLDFVRKITDVNGNETYMYGYGQKRLTLYSDGGIEFKEDVNVENVPDFYRDLETTLRFIEEKLGIEEDQIFLTSAEITGQGSARIYHFIFEVGNFEINTEVTASRVSYFSMLGI